MKKMILTAALIASAVSVTTVFAASSNVNSAYTYTQEERKAVKLEELPEAVKTALSGADFKGKEATEAFLVKNGSSEYYEITLKGDGAESKVKLDKDGKKVA
jgi:uncharacterized membrane-anchored protein